MSCAAEQEPGDQCGDEREGIAMPAKMRAYHHPSHTRCGKRQSDSPSASAARMARRDLAAASSSRPHRSARKHAPPTPIKSARKAIPRGDRKKPVRSKFVIAALPVVRTRRSSSQPAADQRSHSPAGRTRSETARAAARIVSLRRAPRATPRQSCGLKACPRAAMFPRELRRLHHAAIVAEVVRLLDSRQSLAKRLS